MPFVAWWELKTVGLLTRPKLKKKNNLTKESAHKPTKRGKKKGGFYRLGVVCAFGLPNVRSQRLRGPKAKGPMRNQWVSRLMYFFFRKNLYRISSFLSNAYKNCAWVWGVYWVKYFKLWLLLKQNYKNWNIRMMLLDSWWNQLSWYVTLSIWNNLLLQILLVKAWYR